MENNKIFVDLRPDKNLLDPLFGGYKLSLDSVPIYRKCIPSGVDVIQPNDDQFSFAHVKLFSLHNHLHVNPFTQSTYFVDKNWNIQKIRLNLCNKLEDLQVVCKIPALLENKKRLYNVSIKFASANTVILSDGAGTIHVFAIIFENVETWKILSSNTLLEDEAGFLITSAHLEECETKRFLHVIFMHIEEKTDEEKEKSHSALFHTIVEWVTLAQNEDEAYTQKSLRKLEVDGNVEYACIELGCKALHIVSDKIPQWTFDSEKEVVKNFAINLDNDTEIQKLYKWTQEEEEITVWLTVPENIKRTDIQIKINSNNLEIKLFGDIFLSGELFHKIDNDLTSWTLEKNKIEIQLIKQERGLMWQNLISNDKRGEQIFNPELVGKVHEKLAHLCSDKETDAGQVSFNSQQLEECDGIGYDSLTLVRISSETHTITHEVSLSSFQWLFMVPCDPKNVPAICLRYDVDACVWQFGNAENDNIWPYKHIGTFFAFGYVQASKNKKKFVTCPPDLSYAIVCESSHHIYLYRQPSAVHSELRNRVSGKKVETISKQQLINLDTNELILGAYASNSLMYVLSENTIHVLTINE